MRTRRPGRRKLTHIGAVILTLAAMAGVASTSSAQTQLKVRPRPQLGARATPPQCNPTWPTSTQLNGIQSYYSLVVQLQNCQAADIPLSIDIGPNEGKGTSLSGAGGVALPGSAVAWDAGTSAGMPNLNAPAALSIPHGNPTTGGWGSLVGFTTVPYWDGNCGTSPGPYANQNSDVSSCSQTNAPPSMSGSWTLYLPSATFEFNLQQALPFPYVPQYQADGTPPNIPGAVFTGLLVTRSRPGGLQDPIFTQSSPQGYGQSPPATSFVPGNCYDPVAVVNGANGGYATPSNWSYLGNDDNGKTWYFTPAGNDFAPLLPPPNGPYPFPALMLVTGFEDTEGGATNDMALRDSDNSATSTTPHYLQYAIHDVNGVDCSGSDKVFDIPVAIGADLRGLDLASAQLPGGVLANSDLTGGTLTQISVAAGTGDTQPNLSYADLSGTLLSPVSAIGADFEAALLIGTNMSNMNLTRAVFKNTNLLLTNLDGSTTDQANFGGAQFCHTTMPNGSINNTDCATLLTPQAPWQVDTPSCDPLTCVFVSLYNNTTRTVAQGLDWCVDGQFAAPEAPTWIAPLQTGQFGLQPSGSTSTNINCGITFANGAGGKIRVTADTSSGSVKANVDSGTCFAQSSASTDPCLPRAADGTSPVQFSTNQYVKNNATFVDVIMCEPDAVTSNGCPTTAALPGLSGT